RVTPVDRKADVITINGNSMLAIGALAVGMRFYAGYPITPASEIMEYFARELPRFQGSVVQAEDEIAALGMCLGASYSGVKAMTASSGPGISLMVEQINLAGQAEIPVVIADVQRGGASTGMPTKTSQGDLNLAVYGVHNESPRIVLAASSVQDCFCAAVDAFNLSERYQCPVLLLSDQSLATRKQTIPPPDLSAVTVCDRAAPSAEVLEAGYARYKETATGISPMSTPGTPQGAYISTGIEHDEAGDPGYTADLARRMKEKRFRKLSTLLQEQGDRFVTIWDEGSEFDVGVIAFGSTEGAIREAIRRAASEGYSVGHAHVRLLCPLPAGPIESFAKRCKRLLVPELNFSGQFAGLLRTHTDLKFHSYRRDDGTPLLPNEVYREITRLADGADG
ncbi:MAG TPA: hypothetical protein VGS41_06995, partial [Chthonomonadales bacterium]|nr:hypothetical protein [Chthonomonadales bacterium]